MASIYRPTYTVADKSGQRVTKQSKKFWGQYRDHAGKTRRVPLCANKQQAQLLLADLVRGASRPEHQRAAADSLDTVVDAWEQHLRDRGTSTTHVQLVTYRVRQIVKGCGWKLVKDLDAETAVKRLGKLATKGKARGGVSAKTRNDYADALGSFGRWLVMMKRVGENPFAEIRHVPITTDRRHDRRPLTEAELAAFLTAAAESPAVFIGLTGQDRHALYVAAMATGFRAGELASLVPRSFGLDEPTPVVRLAAGSAKNRRAAVQPIPVDLVPFLRDYLRGRDAGAVVWPGKWYRRAAEMVSRDLAAAGVPYVVDGPDGPLYADFHALRHTYIALLDKPGVSLKQAMQLARHTDPRLTMRIYGKAALADLAKAVNGAVPNLVLNLVHATGEVRANAAASERLSIGLAIPIGATDRKTLENGEDMRIGSTTERPVRGSNPYDTPGSTKDTGNLAQILGLAGLDPKIVSLILALVNGGEQRRAA